MAFPAGALSCMLVTLFSSWQRTEIAYDVRESTSGTELELSAQESNDSVALLGGLVPPGSSVVD